MSYKDILGMIATAIAFIGYIPYFRDLFAGRTKPHIFSWLVWGILTAIGFFGQVSDHAGPGAWVTGFSAVICCAIFFFGLKSGEKNIVFLDWISLFGAGVSLIFWFIIQQPLVSVLLITVIDALGFFPTFRKSYYKPFEETVATYILSGLKFVIAFFALENVSVLTTLYPFSLVCMNWLFVMMVYVRRRQHV